MKHLTRDRVKICRVYTPPEQKDGVWILVDKLWPRGLKKGAVEFDLWLKEITPSTPLRQWFHADPLARWEEFSKRYIDELQNNGPLLDQICQIAMDKPVTLFYAAKDTQHNHALILQAVICAWPSSSLE